MKRTLFILLTAATITGLIAATVQTSQPTIIDAAQSIEAGKLPPEYRDWKLISVAREEGAIDDIRAILGNDIAIKAFRDNIRPFPDGAIIARLAWALVPSEENNLAFGKTQSHIAGQPKNGIQFMIKNTAKYASTGGWHYSQFDNGKPLTDQPKLQACFTCHQAISDPSRDYLFTRYAP